MRSAIRPLLPLVMPSRDEGSVCRIVGLSSGFNISLRTPFECQEKVSGWESFLHGIHKAIRILGFPEFFFKCQQVRFRKIYGGSRVKGSTNLAVSRDNDRRS